MGVLREALRDARRPWPCGAQASSSESWSTEAELEAGNGLVSDAMEAHVEESAEPALRKEVGTQVPRKVSEDRVQGARKRILRRDPTPLIGSSQSLPAADAIPALMKESSGDVPRMSLESGVSAAVVSGSETGVLASQGSSSSSEFGSGVAAGVDSISSERAYTHLQSRLDERAERWPPGSGTPPSDPFPSPAPGRTRERRTFPASLAPLLDARPRRRVSESSPAADAPVSNQFPSSSKADPEAATGSFRSPRSLAFAKHPTPSGHEPSTKEERRITPGVAPSGLAPVPGVSIGKIDVVIAAPRKQPTPALTKDLASRRYLRRP
jgi:hypothetical protein